MNPIGGSSATMTTRVLATVIVIALLVALTAASAGAQGPQPRNASASLPAASKFTYYDIDSDYSHNYGQFPSLAIDPSTNTPYVSYYDVLGKKLRLTHMVSSGGNCGYDGGRLAWFCETVRMPATFDGHDVGRYDSMAIYSMGGATPLWKLGIAHYDVTSSSVSPALLYTVCAGTAPGNCIWTTYLVDRTVEPYGGMGAVLSLKFDSAGNPRIAYAAGSASYNNEIRYARYVTSGGTGCYGYDWQCSLAVRVSMSNEFAASLSLDLDGADQPRIAYAQRTINNTFRLEYAWPSGTINGSCGYTDWQCDMIDGSQGGPYVSLLVDKGPLGVPRIAYYSYLSVGLYSVEFATRRLGGGGNCGPSGTWQCDSIDTVQSSPGYMGLALAEDSQGYPVIAYRDPGAPGGGRLRWAQAIARLGLTAGNCGPISLPAGTRMWQCNLVGGPYGVIFGRLASLGINSAGLAYIASYDDSPPGFLEISYQQRQVYLPMTVR